MVFFSITEKATAKLTKATAKLTKATWLLVRQYIILKCIIIALVARKS
jgi:hypothetical protein